MKPTLRDRLVMPVLVPLGTIVLIALVLYGFSRILLSLTPTAATITAITIAAGVLAIASVAASRPQVRLSTLGSMIGATAGLAMLAGGVALAVTAGTEGGGEEGAGPPGAIVALAAANIAFDPTSLTAPAGEPFTIRFHNQDAGVQHNVDIFDNPDFSGDPLFEGELLTGVGQVDYRVHALDPGDYAFRCIVHPTMTGELHVQAGAGGGEGGGGPGGPGPTVIAQNIAFDTDTIELPADQPSTITFENRDAGTQHNIGIYTDSSASQELFKGEFVTGPATVEYQVPAIEAGEYYFHCDVHPNMSGTVVVGEADGGAGEPTGPS